MTADQYVRERVGLLPSSDAQSVRFGALVRATLSLYRRSFGSLIVLTLCVSVPLLGLIATQNEFDPARGTPFPTAFAVRLIVSFGIFLCFVLTQAVVCTGLDRVRQGRPFGTFSAFAVMFSSPVRRWTSALRIAGVVTAWSLLCGIGALIGVRKSFIAMPLQTLRGFGGADALRASDQLTQRHRAKIVGLTVLFLVAYYAGFAVSVVAVARLLDHTHQDFHELTTNAIIPASIWFAFLTTVWSVLTCAMTFRVTDANSAASIERVARVF